MRVKFTPLLAGLCLLAACSAPTPAAPPTTTPPVLVASEAPAATATVPSSPTSAPAATPLPNIPTAPAPATEPATAEVPTQFGPAGFPPDVNPLTGLRVADPSVLDRRPIAIKVSQFPRGVRPQSGLSLADLVFEHYAEAGVTRMTALFLANGAPKVGSIRSARLIDLVLAESYDAMLVTSGSSAGVLSALARTPFYDRVIAEATGYDECPPLCREGAQASTNNLFASTADIWATADGLGLNGRQTLDGMAFALQPPAGGVPVATTHIDFQLDHNVAEWRYDAASGRYSRWMDTETIGELAPQTDAVNGQQLSAANVVVLYANHVTSDIPEDFGNGGHCGYEIQVWGSGPARVFRSGQMYEVTWVRFSQSDVIGLVGPNNQIFPLAPGNTWFAIVDFDSPTTVENGLYATRFRGPSQSQGCPAG